MQIPDYYPASPYKTDSKAIMVKPTQLLFQNFEQQISQECGKRTKYTSNCDHDLCYYNQISKL